MEWLGDKGEAERRKRRVRLSGWLYFSGTCFPELISFGTSSMLTQSKLRLLSSLFILLRMYCRATKAIVLHDPTQGALSLEAIVLHDPTQGALSLEAIVLHDPTQGALSLEAMVLHDPTQGALSLEATLEG